MGGAPVHLTDDDCLGDVSSAHRCSPPRSAGGVIGWRRRSWVCFSKASAHPQADQITPKARAKAGATVDPALPSPYRCVSSLHCTAPHLPDCTSLVRDLLSRNLPPAPPSAPPSSPWARLLEPHLALTRALQLVPPPQQLHSTPKLRPRLPRPASAIATYRCLLLCVLMSLLLTFRCRPA